MTATDFSALKMFKLKCNLIFKNWLPRYCRWRNTNVLINSNLLLKIIIKLSFFKAVSGCPPDSSSIRTARQHTQCATPRSAQNWLRARFPDFITEDHWPPNSPDMNPMDNRVWGAMLEAYRKLKTKPNSGKRFRLSGATCHRDRLLKAIEGLCWSWWWTLRTFTVTMEFLAFDH